MKKIAAILASFLVVACASSPKPVLDTKPSGSNNPSNSVAISAPTAVSSPISAPVVAPSVPSAADAQLAAEILEIKKSKPNADTATAMKLAEEIIKLHQDSVYFDYDQYSLKQEFKPTLDMQAKRIIGAGVKKVILEGNADERGSAAYNLALGEKRATSVKKALVQLGVPASKIKVVSYGNTRPLLDCHEENCWHENRRVDFAFKQK